MLFGGLKSPGFRGLGCFIRIQSRVSDSLPTQLTESTAMMIRLCTFPRKESSQGSAPSLPSTSASVGLTFGVGSGMPCWGALGVGSLH